MELTDKPPVEVMYAAEAGEDKVRVIYKKAMYTREEVSKIMGISYDVLVDTLINGNRTLRNIAVSPGRYMIRHGDLMEYLESEPCRALPATQPANRHLKSVDGMKRWTL